MENAYKDSVGKENKGGGGESVRAMWKVHQARIVLPTNRECSATIGFSFRSGNTWDCFITINVLISREVRILLETSQHGCVNKQGTPHTHVYRVLKKEQSFTGILKLLSDVTTRPGNTANTLYNTHIHWAAHETDKTNIKQAVCLCMFTFLSREFPSWRRSSKHIEWEQ